MPDTSWSTYVCRSAAFGDTRLKQRLMHIVDALLTHPQASLPEALGTPQAVRAYYDFLANPRVTDAALLQVAQADVVARLEEGQVVLVTHDTSEYNYSTHTATPGLGPLSNPVARGLHVHSVLAQLPEGLPLGVLHCESWARDPATTGRRHQRRQRAHDDKESARWTRGLDAVHALVPPTVTVIHLADREADLYPLWVAERPAHSHLLIRVRHDRRVVARTPDLRRLRAAVAATPAIGGQYVEVARRPGHAPRCAKVELHVTPVTIRRPDTLPAGAYPATVPLTLVWAVEVDPPAGVPPLEWLLATTLPVADLASAQQITQWYSRRWLIERYHYVLKSGLRLEDLQVRTAVALQHALLIASLVAVRLLWITYAARLLPTAPCTLALSPCEWQTLHLATQTTSLPTQPPSLAEAVGQLAQLGGHRPWPSAGPPGVQVLWRGWRILQHMVTYANRLQAYQALFERTGT